MSKILFVPSGVIGGRTRRLDSTESLRTLRSMFDDEEALIPSNVDFLEELIPARCSRVPSSGQHVTFDHGTREAFSKLSGRWAGDEHSQAP